MGLIMRRNLMAAKSGYTAKDYVQDGLIAMWDGIENAGWGVHDPNMTDWMNLGSLGGYATKNGTPIVYADHIRLQDQTDENMSYFNTGINCSYFIGLNLTFEVLCTSELVLSSDGVGIFSCIQSAGLGLKPTASGKRFYFNDGSAKTVFADNEQIWTTPVSISNTKSENHISAYKNGTFVASKSGVGVLRNSNQNMWIGADPGGSGLAFNAPMTGNIYCVRFYGRDLSDAEIAANYAIDKARFGLP